MRPNISVNKGLPKSPGGSQEYWAHLKVLHQSSARNAIQLLYHVKEKIIIIWASITSSGPRSRRRWPCQLRRRHLPWRSRRFHSPVRLDDKFRISFWALQLYPKVSREVAKSANCYVMHLQGALKVTRHWKLLLCPILSALNVGLLPGEVPVNVIKQGV